MPPVPLVDHRGEAIPASIRLSMLAKGTERYEEHPLKDFGRTTRMQLLRILEQLPDLSKSDAQLDRYSQRVLDTLNNVKELTYTVAELVGRMRLHDAYIPIEAKNESNSDISWGGIFNQSLSDLRNDFNRNPQSSWSDAIRQMIIDFKGDIRKGR